MTRGIVAAPHHLASEVGAQVLRDGGNAVDAAVAANAVLCVVYPHMTSIGGDLFAMVWPAGAAEPVGLESGGASGSLATMAAVRAAGHERMPERGAMTVTVPGTAAGWGRLVEEYGTLGLGPVIGPAAAIAREGFLITPGLAAQIHASAEWLLQEPEARRLLPPMQPGMLLRNPELGETLQAIAKNGFYTFYRGTVADAIVESVQARGGFLTRDDLARHRPRWVRPVHARYRDVTVFEMPAPTQGLVTLGMLLRLGARGSTPALGPAFVRLLKELRDEVYPLRDQYITDPDFSPTPEAPFLDPAVRAGGGGSMVPEGDTVCLCAADEHGNLVSIVQSVAESFGSGIFAEGTGVLLHNRGRYFSLEADHANRLEPRKRTMHTLIPALAARTGRPWLAFGNMGSDAQPQVQVQVVTNLVDRGQDPQAAVSAPRVRVAPDGDRVVVEADYPGALDLQKSGMNVHLVPPRNSYMGHAQAVVVEPDGGGWRGGADPRADGSVVVV